MKNWDTYLKRYAFKDKLIREPPASGLGIILVIPAFREPDLLPALESINECTKPSCNVEVIVIINESKSVSETASQLNKACYQEAKKWAFARKPEWLQYHIQMISAIPSKKHGVGTARKLGMDEAVRRFDSLNNPNGIITGYDADCSCDSNYFTALEAHFISNPLCPGVSIYYEHSLKIMDQNRDKIIQYELHLRVLVHAQRNAGFETYQTVGSSMAVVADAYVKQGGMNTKKAGEDFYFITRIQQLGGYMDLNKTTIYPSSRSSDRVPFGTGRAMLHWEQDPLTTYAPQSYEDLSRFVQLAAKDISIEEIIGKVPKSLKEFLVGNFKDRYVDIQQFTKTEASFHRKLKAEFNPFMVMKYLHFARDHYYKNVPVTETAGWLLKQLQIYNGEQNAESMLLAFRNLDRL